MISLRTFSRLFVGLVFLFSGFVKGVDPLGTAYRIEDYFIAYGADWAMPFALFLSIALSTLEFVLGIALFFNTRIKALSWILFALMLFFTGLTFYDALYNPVPDCGCFGDAIKLTNWQTFYKNVVLMVFVFVIFKQRHKFKSLISNKTQNVIVLLFVLVFSIFSVYQYNHLPMIDFRNWKIGNDMKSKEAVPDKVYLIYQNKESGEQQEFLSPDYPWSDSVWMSQWEFVDQRVESGVNTTHDLYISTIDGYDITRDIIENQDYQFLFISWDLNKAPVDALDHIKRLTPFFDENDIFIVGLTGSLTQDIEMISEKHQIDFNFYSVDDIVLKTMIRANPGLMLLKNGIVLNKWHHNDFPDIDELEKVLSLE